MCISVEASEEGRVSTTTTSNFEAVPVGDEEEVGCRICNDDKVFDTAGIRRHVEGYHNTTYTKYMVMT